MNRPGNRWNPQESVQMFTSRPGQPPQRPPSLGPSPALGGPFRGPYPAYGMPPRNVMPGYPALPNHRSTQNVVPQPSPNYLQQRAQSTFPFTAGALQQQQSQQPQTQHTAQSPLSHTPHPQTQSSATPTLPLHLSQAATPSIGTAPSVSSASDVGLDPNDFPALGSAPANNSNTPSSNNTTSYASQAGTGVQMSAGAGGVQPTGAAGGNQPRDFTPDDFPALGGQNQSSHQQQPSQQQAQQQGSESHPPGLNGFQQHGDQQHRQTLLGSLTGGTQTPSMGSGQQQQQPGLLNIGQARNVHPGFQSDAEKQRNYALKLNQGNHSTAAPAAWSSPNANPSAQQASSFPSTVTNGARQNHTSQQQQHLAAPPGVPPPSQQQSQTHGAVALPAIQQTPYVGNGTAAGDTAHHPSQGPVHATSAVPQTPAQQVLMSPADRWGLLGLLALIKNADPDQTLLSIGTDLGTMGLDMQTQGSLYSAFITPWADSSAARTVEPDFHLPACYNVQPPPPGSSKAAAFSDETLFFMFYSSPRDALQEIAAQELWNRNWRYHKESRIWLTKETGTTASQKVPGGEHGTYSCWDPDNWEKTRREMTVLYADLEEKAPLPAYAPTQPIATSQLQTAAPTQRVGALQGMGMAAM
ncbi:uncharacterized protein FIBRA_05884 [Fibroporia radiculosa]|uniref:NOT2/NOT3/NOT5 C-terminal domain-containing protein n=1 Tax=Fibroporia radiculosa TaxID=599839 RepID=J4GAA2_9APHY|nr:uncharacterized protein FIBRA_05884 [Fibroporia radiculosa]CCM03738.1 predicted protein [Fibroporia radiculosa]